MKKVRLLVTLLAVMLLVNGKCFSQASHAQSSLPVKDEPTPSTEVKKWQGISLPVINKDQLFQNIRESGKELNMVVIVTSGCGGTPGAIKYLKEVEEKYGNKVASFLLFSDSYKNSDDVKKILSRYNYQNQVYIIDQNYGEKRDDRKKGTTFRNSFCDECQKDIIGVPYNLVFDKKLNILLHGYPNFRGPLQQIPSDYIGWLLDKASKAQ